jgi:Protein of unknown function (DUF3579)
MNLIKEFHVVFGKSPEGRKFRPSDWIERLCAIAARYDEDRRLRYSPYLSPCVVHGELALRVGRKLALSNPDVYAFVMEFVSSNNLLMHTPGEAPANQPLDSLPRCA